MKPYLGLVFGAVATVFAIDAEAASMKVIRSFETAFPADEAWNLIGDFCDIDDWHPAISGCRLKVIEGTLHRVLTLEDGAEFVEKRVAVEPGHSYTYRIVSSPLPIEKYTATLSITRGSVSTISWSGRFSAEDPEMENVISDIYEAGLASIEDRLSD